MSLNEMYQSKLLDIIKNYQFLHTKMLKEIIRRTNEDLCKELYEWLVSNDEIEFYEDKMTLGNFYGIFIGINTYEKYSESGNILDRANDFRSLSYACKDAIDFKTLISKINPESKTSLLIDNNEAGNGNSIKGRNPDLSNIVDTLYQIAKKSKETDTILFFFSGHGERIQEDQIDLLIPTNYSINKLDLTSLKLESVVDILIESEATNLIIIIDVCRNEKKYKGTIGKLSGFDYLANQNKNLSVFYSCHAGEISIEIGEGYENGMFTHHLLKEIEKRIEDETNLIFLDDLALSVIQAVGDDTLTDQNPQLINITDLANKYEVPIIKIMPHND